LMIFHTSMSGLHQSSCRSVYGTCTPSKQQPEQQTQHEQSTTLTRTCGLWNLEL
jgi:hypothetical protein